MNGKIRVILGIVLVFCAVCAAGVYYLFTNQNKEVVNMGDKKVLIAYYSHSGNTEAAAKKIQAVTGGDLFEIQPKTPYPKDYNIVVSQAQEEKRNDVSPELIDNGDVKDYDIIFLGTPVWWYTMASPVKTFLAENDFGGKVIAPFCTHGGGGESATYTDMQKLAPDAKVLTGYTSYENSASDKEIRSWINDLNLQGE